MIKYNEKNRLFKLSTADMTYAIKIAPGNYVAHVYFGKEIPDEDLTWLLRLDENPFTPETNARDKAVYMDTLPFEYPCLGTGDFREHAFSVLDKDGMSTVDLRYKSHIIYNGKPKLKGLPATFADENKAQTLEITCVDEYCGIEVVLIYSVIENYSSVIRSVRIKNNSTNPVNITRAMSMALQLDSDKYDMHTFYGSWARERHLERSKLHHGKQSIDSLRGESSHQHNPFFMLVSHTADEKQGEAYGFSLVYSGNFFAQAEVTQHSKTGVTMGINYVDFNWLLEEGEEFQTPEVVMVYSSSGIGNMSRTYHDLYRNHLIRSKFKNTRRPVLINNWEATYFDFNYEKLLNIARDASELGIEMLVMDDGWFGHRDSDNSSLGDWFVYEKKLSPGLPQLVSEVNKLGLKFGIWFEPEMISPDSELYKKHPEWAIQVKGRPLTLCREQYVLDYSQKEVRDYIYEMLRKILTSANIEYVKWDMNRQLTEAGSCFLRADRQREIWHRYVLGVYEMMERFTTDFPDILLENCSGGGARFDPGMLYYSPQIWCSDDTDAIERLKIQYGTSMCYPPSAIGAHVSDCPNHSCGRITPFETRGHVAMSGTFGYELDTTRISENDRQMIKEQIKQYKKYCHLIINGDQYRLGNVFSDISYDAWLFISKDKTQALLTYVQVLAKANERSKRIKLDGLNPDWYYKNDVNDLVLSGSALMNGGFNFENLWGDFKSKQVYFTRVEK
ncbi:MAG: alpha-galactosidase [Ruminococcus sp.]|nr:alpha-galactosidase [Ruminococcus sp.]